MNAQNILLVSLAHFHTEIYEVIFFKEENACYVHTIFYTNAISLNFFPQKLLVLQENVASKNKDPHKVIILSNLI